MLLLSADLQQTNSAEFQHPSFSIPKPSRGMGAPRGPGSCRGRRFRRRRNGGCRGFLPRPQLFCPLRISTLVRFRNDTCSLMVMFGTSASRFLLVPRLPTDSFMFFRRNLRADLVCSRESYRVSPSSDSSQAREQWPKHENADLDTEKGTRACIQADGRGARSARRGVRGRS